MSSKFGLVDDAKLSGIVQLLAVDVISQACVDEESLLRND